jgi:DNA-directed RNA polymerase subunit RPC12/RpoP
MLSKVYCSECGKEICDGEIAFITYIDPEDADKGLIACEECNKRVYSAS